MICLNIFVRFIYFHNRWRIVNPMAKTVDLKKLEEFIMRKYTEEHDDETEREMESAGLEAIVDVLKDQQDTQREAISMFQTLGMAFLETLKEIRTLEIDRLKVQDAKTLKLEKAKHEFEERKYNDSRLEIITQQPSHIGKSAKDVPKLSKTALAAKSGTSAKSKAKSGSGTRKKTT